MTGPLVDDTVEGLYRDHRRRLIGLASAITLEPHVAEEIVHDAFIGLHRHRDRVLDPVAYLQRSVVNRSVSLVRRRRVASRAPVPVVLPAEMAELDETWALVATLPAKQRAVVVLRFWADMSVDAIAETLDWPAGSVKSTLHRALARLRTELTS